jgi:hypothetical protein
MVRFSVDDSVRWLSLFLPCDQKGYDKNNFPQSFAPVLIHQYRAKSETLFPVFLACSLSVSAAFFVLTWP